LHPSAQEKLVAVLSEAARRFGTQVILSTHSPSVVRALPAEAKVIWMKEGKVQPNADDAARNLMGWGLLDKRILLMTEDTGSSMLQSIISQWPDLERVTAIWPFHGTGKLPPPETLNGLKNLFGDTVEIVIHRDRDFMMPDEVAALAQPYQDKGFEFWATKCSDIEGYWAENQVIQAHFGIDEVEAAAVIAEATVLACEDDKALQKRRKKRLDAMQKIPEAKKGELPQYGDAQVEGEAATHGDQHKVLGKDITKAIRKAAQDRKYQGATNFGKSVPSSLQDCLVDDLRAILQAIV